MSEPNSPTAPGERTYQFISDPGHKENLSGRVRAACLTCRRKKIKCSGELNCATCREKGLVCEGLPERKRPTKESGSSHILSPALPSRIERKKRAASPRKSSPHARTAPNLPSLDVLESNDSGYASTQPDGNESTLSPESLAPTNDAVPEASSSNVPKTASKATHDGGLQIHTWHLNDAPLIPDPSEPLQVSSPPTFPEMQNSATALSADSTKSPPIDWSHFQGGNLWTRRTGERPQNCAMPVHDPGALDNMPANMPTHDVARRQTIAFPLESPGAAAPQFDYLQNQPGVFDDLALLLSTNRTPGSGMTPYMTDFSTWWDIATLDFAQAHANLHIPINEQQQQTATLEAETASPMPQQQEQERRPRRRDKVNTDFFDLWPAAG